MTGHFVKVTRPGESLSLACTPIEGICQDQENTPCKSKLLERLSIRPTVCVFLLASDYEERKEHEPLVTQLTNESCLMKRPKLDVYSYWLRGKGQEPCSCGPCIITPHNRQETKSVTHNLSQSEQLMIPSTNRRGHQNTPQNVDNQAITIIGVI